MLCSHRDHHHRSNQRQTERILIGSQCPDQTCDTVRCHGLTPHGAFLALVFLPVPSMLRRTQSISKGEAKGGYQSQGKNGQQSPTFHIPTGETRPAEPIRRNKLTWVQSPQ